MNDYVGKLRTAHYRLADIGMELPEIQLVYILIGGLGIEFDTWTANVRKSAKPPTFDVLATELIETFQHKAKPLSAPKMPQRYVCAHCGLDHPSDNCYEMYS